VFSAEKEPDAVVIASADSLAPGNSD